MKGFNEFEWIKKLPKQQKDGLVLGIGDDAAIIDFDKNCSVSTDSLVEGSHFLRNDDPYFIGRKTAAVNLSDMAAMGCSADYFLLNLHIPEWFNNDKCEAFKNGLTDLLDEHQTILIGGDTVLSKGELLHCVGTVMGQPFENKAITRSGAQNEDLIIVSGALGGSFPKRHLTFEPRLKLSQQICSSLAPTSMIDISDGILQDLNHISKASNMGAKVNLGSIPIHPDIQKNENALQQAVSDGEDFELLFTIPKKNKVLVEKFDELTIIGSMSNDTQHLLVKEKEEETFRQIIPKGFQHNR